MVLKLPYGQIFWTKKISVLECPKAGIEVGSPLADSYAIWVYFRYHTASLYRLKLLHRGQALYLK